jgi:hypothetical protein
MLAALCLAIVFTISLTSFLELSYLSVRMSTRHIMGAHAQEVAEAGLELALYSQNYEQPAWPGWTIAGGVATANLTMTANGLVLTSSNPTPLNFGNGATVQVTLTVNGISSTQPVFTSTATATLPNDLITITRTISATGAPTPTFVNALAATGLYNPGAVSFVGSATVDSYTSYGTAAPYTFGYEAVVLSQRDTSGSGATVTLTNSVVNGWASGINFDSPSTTNWLSYAGNGQVVGIPPHAVYIDSSRVITNPLPYQPTFNEAAPGPLTATTVDTTAGPVSLGVAGTTQSYSATVVNLTGTFPLYITGHVILWVSGDFKLNPNGGDTSNIIFNDSPATNAPSLEVHLTTSSSNLTLNGSPSANTPLSQVNGSTVIERPALLAFVSNIDSTGTIAVTGSTYPISAVCYFPKNRVSLYGNTTFYGSLVGGTVLINASAAIHYDTSLRNTILNPVTDPSLHAFASPISLGAITESPLP